MGYPKQMYKGTYTPDAIQAEEKPVQDEKEEKSARKQGFIDGHEFFSKPPAEESATAVVRQYNSDTKAASGKFDASLGK